MMKIIIGLFLLVFGLYLIVSGIWRLGYHACNEQRVIASDAPNNEIQLVPPLVDSVMTLSPGESVILPIAHFWLNEGDTVISEHTTNGQNIPTVEAYTVIDGRLVPINQPDAPPTGSMMWEPPSRVSGGVSRQNKSTHQQ